MSRNISCDLMPVYCPRGGHHWKYSKGKPKYRIRCPKCRSTRNELNRYVFGKCIRHITIGLLLGFIVIMTFFIVDVLTRSVTTGAVISGLLIAYYTAIKGN